MVSAWGYCVNLMTFISTGADILTDHFMTTTIQNGPFRNNLQMDVSATRHSVWSTKADELLSSNCEHLATLGILAI